jgi:carotenoid cleavage dioxygenase-like enzyme
MAWFQVHIHLVNRHTGEVSDKTYVSNPFFFFHTINAYQKGSSVIIDLVIYKDADVKTFLSIHNLN